MKISSLQIIVAILICGMMLIFGAPGQTSKISPIAHHRFNNVAKLPSRPLFNRAQRLFRADHAWSWDGWDHDEYRWISDHELFYADYYKLRTGSGRVEMAHMYRRDIRTGKKIELKRLEQLVNCFYHSHIELSPDGKWILWNDGIDETTIDVARLNGREHRQWPGGYYTGHLLGWTRDSRHWLEIKNDANGSFQLPTTVLVHDIDRPSRDQSFRITNGPGEYEGYAIGRQIAVIDQPSPGETTHWLDVMEYSLPPHIRWKRTEEIRLPADLPHPNVTNVILSPDATKIAFIVGYGPSPVEVFTGTGPEIPHAPKRGATTVRNYAIYVCRTNGAAMHEIGSWQEEMNPAVILDLESLRWLPSGKRLSFIDHDVLYTVPAE